MATSKDGSRDPASSSVLASRIALLRKRPVESASMLSTNRQFCPHCDLNLALKTFRKHRKLFFRSDGSWVRTDKRKDNEGTRQLCETRSDGRAYEACNVV